MKKITVILPVYNAAQFLSETLESLFVQTEQAFTVLAVDDGSTDTSLQILKSATDPRLTIVSNDRNLGLVATLNRAVGMVQTPYIVRMDSDDVAVPERFARQLTYLEAHPAVGVLGTWAADWATGSILTRPVTDSAIKAELLSDSALIHPSVMIRTDLLRSVSYSTAYPHAEDFKLWVDLAQSTEFHNLPETLLRYRAHSGQVSARHGAQQRSSRVGILREYLESWMGESLSDDAFESHLELIGIRPVRNPASILDWAQRLRNAKNGSGTETRLELESFLSRQLGRRLNDTYRESLLAKVRRKLFVPSPSGKV